MLFTLEYNYVLSSSGNWHSRYRWHITWNMPCAWEGHWHWWTPLGRPFYHRYGTERKTNRLNMKLPRKERNNISRHILQWRDRYCHQWACGGNLKTHGNKKIRNKERKKYQAAVSECCLQCTFPAKYILKNLFCMPNPCHHACTLVIVRSVSKKEQVRRFTERLHQRWWGWKRKREKWELGLTITRDELENELPWRSTFNQRHRRAADLPSPRRLTSTKRTHCPGP